jgi:LPS export ABC transporter protein LptC
MTWRDTGALICYLSFACLMHCDRSDRPDQQLIHNMEPQKIPDREGWDATLRISSEGKLQAIIDYGHMTYFNDSRKNFFDQGIHVDMYGTRGEHTTTLTADKGEFHEGSQDIWAIGNVIVVSDTGVTLHTPVLRWDQHLEKIISDTVIMITTTDKDTIYGTAFESDPDLTHMVIQNPTGSKQEGVDISAMEKEFITGHPDGADIKNEK